MKSRSRSSGIGQDHSGKWRKKVDALASDLGYETEGLWYWWSQIAAARELHHAAIMDRDVHEEQAYRNCVEIFDQRGRTAD